MDETEVGTTEYVCKIYPSNNGFTEYLKFKFYLDGFMQKKRAN